MRFGFILVLVSHWKNDHSSLVKLNSEGEGQYEWKYFSSVEPCVNRRKSTFCRDANKKIKMKSLKFLIFKTWLYTYIRHGTLYIRICRHPISPFQVCNLAFWKKCTVHKTKDLSEKYLYVLKWIFPCTCMWVNLEIVEN